MHNSTAKILTMQLNYPSVDINPQTVPSAYRDTISPICRTHDESPIFFKYSDQHQWESITIPVNFRVRERTRRSKTSFAKPTVTASQMTTPIKHLRTDAISWSTIRRTPTICRPSLPRKRTVKSSEPPLHYSFGHYKPTITATRFQDTTSMRTVLQSAGCGHTHSTDWAPQTRRRLADCLCVFGNPAHTALCFLQMCRQQ